MATRAGAHKQTYTNRQTDIDFSSWGQVGSVRASRAEPSPFILNSSPRIRRRFPPRCSPDLCAISSVLSPVFVAPCALVLPRFPRPCRPRTVHVSALRAATCNYCLPPQRGPAPAARKHGPRRHPPCLHSLPPNTATRRRLPAPIRPRRSSCAAGCNTYPARSNHLLRSSPLRAADLRAAARRSPFPPQP